MKLSKRGLVVVVLATRSPYRTLLCLYLVSMVALFANSAAAQQTVFVTDFSPRQAKHGDIITVTGSGFLSSSTPPTHADLNTAPGAPVRVLSDTQWEFEVLPHFVTNKIWLRNINANQSVLNVAFSADPLEILGTPSGPPAAPDQVLTQVGSDETLDVYWHDNAIDEQGYELTIDIGVFGYTTFQFGADTEHYRVNLKALTPNPAGRAYRVGVCAWNQHGKGCSDYVTSDVVSNSQPPDPEQNWVRILDSTVSVNGNPSHVPTPPLAASATKTTFRAIEVQAYWDTNGNGLVDNHPFPTVMAGAIFPLETGPQPADSQGRTYNTVYGIKYACDATSGKCANLIVIMVIEPTGGQPSADANAYLAVHYHYDANTNMFWIFDVRGGDWAVGAGKTMIWPGSAPNGFSPPTLNIQIPSPSSSNGYVEGTLEVPLLFIETFSYLDGNGLPAVGTITYESVVEAAFAVSIIPN